MVYGILGYHNDVPLSARDKTSEITNGTLNVLTVGLRGLKGDTGPKGDKGDKVDFEFDGKTTMAADLNMAAKKIIHLATPSDAGGTIAGGATTSPIVVGIIPGSALMLKTYCEMKDFKKKIE
ncbi:hypothetical protein pdam_00022491 [Pocillopora damicornis]|uniref:Uncharacterized protein n=1 Tax=Pocillopora damicornis TaxID=46731 RepID=A0A3M6TN50_POCDA|nr:hypothetical protein pdam_00022491 [Pocillopora damicornis]